MAGIGEVLDAGRNWILDIGDWILKLARRRLILDARYWILVQTRLPNRQVAIGIGWQKKAP